MNGYFLKYKEKSCFVVFFQLWNQFKKCATFYINISVQDMYPPGLYLLGNIWSCLRKKISTIISPLN